MTKLAHLHQKTLANTAKKNRPLTHRAIALGTAGALLLGGSITALNSLRGCWSEDVSENATSAEAGPGESTKITKIPASGKAGLGAPPPIWPHDFSNIPPHPGVDWGVLANGLRYAVLRHPIPEGQLSLRLMVEAGSLMEEDDQRGIAHLVEHMAFNGTRHFQAGEAFEQFERLAIKKGADANAHTGYRHTVYDLDLPKNDPETIALALTFFRDAADGMLFDPKELDAERKVVVAEHREREEPGNEWIWQFTLPASLYSKRRPIGDPLIVAGTPRHRIVAFHQKWYTANRMIIVAAGDLKAADIAEQIAAHFGSLPASARASDPDVGDIISGRGGSVGISPDPSDIQKLTFSSLKPTDPAAIDLARVEAEVHRALANITFENRLSDLARSWYNRSLLRVDAYGSEIDLGLHRMGVKIWIRNGAWRKATRTLAEEWRRARDLGFNHWEIEEAKSRLYLRSRYRFLQGIQKTSAGVANGIVESLRERRVFVSPADALTRSFGLTRVADAKRCSEVFRELWEAGEFVIVGAGDFDEAGEDTLERQLEMGWGPPPIPREEKKRPKFVPPALGARGEVALRVRHEDLEMTTAQFENGVNLAVKTIAHVPETVSLRLTFGRGLRDADGSIHPYIAGAAVHNAGNGKLDGEKLTEALAGRDISVDFKISDDCFQFGVVCAPIDLPTACQVVASYLLRPPWKELEREFPASAFLESRRIRERLTPQSLEFGAVSHVLHGLDRRFAPLAERPSGITPEANRWIHTPMTTGPLQLAIVGDVSPTAAIRAVAATFGAMPPRPPASVDSTLPQRLRDPEPGPHVLQFTEPSRNARVLLAFRTEPAADVSTKRTLEVLRRVVGSRLRESLRETLGESYSPYCRLDTSTAFEGYGFLIVSAPCHYKKVAEVSQAAHAVVEGLTGNPITDDERLRAAAPLSTATNLARRSHRYWLKALSRHTSDPAALQRTLDHVESYASITTENLRLAAGRIFVPEAAIEFHLMPEAPLAE